MNRLRFITTSRGVRIGAAYIPKQQSMTADQERIQAALLEPKAARPVSRLQRLLGAILRWR